MTQRPRACASRRRSTIASAPAGLQVLMAENTASSAIKAAYVASNSEAGTASAVAAKA